MQCYEFGCGKSTCYEAIAQRNLKIACSALLHRRYYILESVAQCASKLARSASAIRGC